jgi:hypothetical protein
MELESRLLLEDGTALEITRRRGKPNAITTRWREIPFISSHSLLMKMISFCCYCSINLYTNPERGCPFYLISIAHSKSQKGWETST